MVAWLSSLPRTPSSVLITAKPYRATRSNEQNRYYWGVLIESVVAWAESRGYGWEPEDAHAWIKSNFFLDVGAFEEYVLYLKDGVLTPQDFLFQIRELFAETTTTDKDTKEFAEKVDTIRAYFLKNHKWHIPTPDEAPLPNDPL